MDNNPKFNAIIVTKSSNIRMYKKIIKKILTASKYKPY